jgi:hypothetical protein
VRIPSTVVVSSRIARNASRLDSKLRAARSANSSSQAKLCWAVDTPDWSSTKNLSDT